MTVTLKKNLLAYARSLGFAGFGVTRAEPLLDHAVRLKQWLAQGFEGNMDYMRRDPERRADPQMNLPGAKSVIVLTMPYHDSNTSIGTVPNGAFKSSVGTVPTGALECSISKYAAGVDYHKTIQKRLDAFVRYLEAIAPGHPSRTFVDTGPLLERALAQRAGIGFVGKNTLVITRGQGSWVFLASVLTTLELPEDSPDVRTCGTCRLCLDACPTGAFLGPFELDARKCISYLTIEQDGPIEPSLRSKMDGWVFGCDVCQDVCPHNRREFPVLQDTRYNQPLTLEEILSIADQETFKRRFAGTAFLRAGRESLVRNACVAAANLKRTDLSVTLQQLANEDPSPVIREHAAWAVERLGSPLPD